MISRLKDDHHRIRTAAAALRACLAGEEAPTAPDFARCRWELIRELSIHMALERHAVDSLARQAAGPRSPAELDATLEDEIRRHMVAWTESSIRARWQSYRRETSGLLDRLQRQMTMEERTLFPLLAGLPDPGIRPPPPAMAHVAQR